MNQSQTPLWKQILAVFLFAIFSAASCWYFFDVVIDLMQGIYSDQAAIVFEKGGFYFPGIAIASGALAFIYGVETYHQAMPSESLTNRIKKIVILGLAIMLLLPHVAYVGISTHLESHSYVECTVLTRKWVHSHTLVYTNSVTLCNSLAAEKNKKNI